MLRLCNACKNRLLFLPLSKSLAAPDSKRWRTGDLIQKAQNAPLIDDQAQALHDVLMEIAGERHAINPRILGRWIERHTDDRCNGLFITRAGERCRAALWRIQKAE